MEIPQIDEQINHSIIFNNTLIKMYKSYNMYSHEVVVHDKKIFIGSIYNEDIVVLRVEYIVFGSYSKEKNVWIWADQSQSINKNAKILISRLRSSISKSIDNQNVNHSDNQNDKQFDLGIKSDKNLINKLKNFCSINYIVLATTELCKYLNYISIIVSEQIKDSIILTSERGNNIDILIVKKILFNNINF